jgi:hypothetical protein
MVILSTEAMSNRAVRAGRRCFFPELETEKEKKNLTRNFRNAADILSTILRRISKQANL